MFAHTQHHFARIQADPDLQWHAVCALGLFAVVAHEVLHGQRSACRAHGVVLGGDRRAEQRHDAVAHDLAHRAAVLLDGFAHVLEYWVEQRARFLRIAIGDEFHRSFEVGEENGDELSFAFDGGGGGDQAFGAVGQPCRRRRRRSGDGMCALWAELGGAGQRGATRGTGQDGRDVRHVQERGFVTSVWNTSNGALWTSGRRSRDLARCRA